MNEPAPENQSSDSSNSTSTGNTANSACCGMGGKIDFQFILKRAQDVLFDPKGCWQRIREEATTEREIYTRYLLVMAAIPVVCQFIRQCIFGYTVLGQSFRMPFFGGLIYHLFYYVGSLMMVYLAAIIIEKLAPKFEGSVTRLNALKLVAYSYTPAYVAGISSLAPGATLQLVIGLFGLYSLYVLYQGMIAMVGVPSTRRNAYFGVSLASIIVAAVVLFMIISGISRPAVGGPDFSKFPGQARSGEL